MDNSTLNGHSFLEQIAIDLAKRDTRDFRDTTLIFANKRAGIYFHQYLAKACGNSIWSPQVLSFEEFVKDQAGGSNTDRLQLLFILFEEYNKVYQRQEGLDQFIFWGEMLLKDFDEIDRYLVDPESLFTNLKDLREIEGMEFLDEEQIKIIEKFWNIADSGKARTQWIEFWKKLSFVYSNFSKRIEKENKGYAGKWLRKLAENPELIQIQPNHIYYFAGFNALTRAEERVIKEMMAKANAKIYWDYDEFYLKEGHEAGKFFRKYKKYSFFENSFKTETNNFIGKVDQQIKVISTSSWTAQVKLVAQELNRLSKDPDWVPESTAVILPDENLLLPMLNSLPDSIKEFNVTMGYSVGHSSAYNLFDLLVRLYKNSRKRNEKSEYQIESLLLIFRTPLVKVLYPNAEKELRNAANLNKKYWWKVEDISPVVSGELISMIFDSEEILIYKRISMIFDALSLMQYSDWDQVFINKVAAILQKVMYSIETFALILNIDSFKRLVKQLAGIQKVPFSGEPLNGVQIMGVLETRNLDFKHLFILSLNEEFMPGGSFQQSFVPQSLRLAFGLPSQNDSQSVQSYLFYRMIQRCPEIQLFYNTNPDSGGGDTSRYIYQLKYDYPVSPEFVPHLAPVVLSEDKVIKISNPEIGKTELRRYYEGDNSYLSPSGVHSFVECSMKFYFKYVIKLNVPEEPEDLIDARIYGLVLHKAMENVYKDGEDSFRKKGDLTTEEVQQIIDLAMEDEVGAGNKQEEKWQGKYLITYELISKTVHRIYEMDKQGKNFEIVGLEETYYRNLEVGGFNLKLGGNLDRVDRVGNVVRIIDYKTGADLTTVPNMEKLMEGKHKGIFQLLFYSWLYYPSLGHQEEIMPLLLKTREIFNGDSSFPNVKIAQKEVVSAGELLAEFEDLLKNIFEEIFVHGNFNQTEDLKTCEYCDFATICRR